MGEPEAASFEELARGEKFDAKLDPAFTGATIREWGS